MKRYLKNYQPIAVKNIFRGREVCFRKKQVQAFNMDDEEESARYHFWVERYGFIGDITSKVVIKDEVNNT